MAVCATLIGGSLHAAPALIATLYSIHMLSRACQLSALPFLRLNILFDLILIRVLIIEIIR